MSKSALGNVLATAHDAKLMATQFDGPNILDVAGSVEELEEIANNANNAIVGISNGLVGISSLMIGYDKDTGDMERAAFEIGWLLGELGGALVSLNELKDSAQLGLEVKKRQQAGRQKKAK